MTCDGCIMGSVVPACATDPLNVALQACESSTCQAECTTPDACNPVTNQGCTGKDACDFDGASFQCQPPPNNAPTCGMCGEGSGPYCKAGNTCAVQGATKCARYCCDDGDCAGGKCDMTALGAVGLKVGVCLGGNVGGAATDPTCAAPVVSPSGGMCFTF
jgi:hypothetical protein